MSRPHDPLPLDRDLRALQQRIAQQKALVHRMIVQGTPTQAAEDELRRLQQILSRLKEQRQRYRAGYLQRAIRERRHK
jgi:hypothetical protein